MGVRFDEFEGDGLGDDVAEKFKVVDVGDGGGWGVLVSGIWDREGECLLNSVMEE